ncbi:branched-chain amino acid ABC transporter permease [Mesoaciditoga lauensis]|uniref:branched-chain amino acid ABC transporter permease n=1 Tax=Mesoaciditoga lauensis TaxID=1495039 RepID=UPI00056437A0|nr:branched-chain amino acid ABC transporter permease [Mesoaciditoga lauensis]
MSHIAQNLINGTLLGGLYALIAIGYTMVYGILRLINFAHGDILMWGVYFALYTVIALSMPWWLGFLVGIALAGLLGFTVEKVAYRPLRNAPRISALITAIGISFFLESLAVVVFGGIPKSFNIYPKFFNKIIIFNHLRIQMLTFFILGVTFVLLFGVLWLLYRTKTGTAMRAIATDIPTTSLMGANVDNIISLTFIIGSMLAATSGIMWAMRYPQVQPYMGFVPGLKAFIAAVIGGIGSVPGAVVGGFILGMTEILVVGFFPNLAGYRDVFAYVILIVLLMFRPTGIFTVYSEQKV